MNATVLLVCVFDPVDELDGRLGVMSVDAELASRLVGQHRAELVSTHCNESMRYVAGSAAYAAADDALRVARERVSVRKIRPPARPGH